MPRCTSNSELDRSRYRARYLDALPMPIGSGISTDIGASVVGALNVTSRDGIVDLTCFMRMVEESLIKRILSLWSLFPVALVISLLPF